jgi:hypothetical protein
MIKGVKLKEKKNKDKLLVACFWGKKVTKKIFLKGIYKIVLHPPQNINKNRSTKVNVFRLKFRSNICWLILAYILEQKK